MSFRHRAVLVSLALAVAVYATFFRATRPGEPTGIGQPMPIAEFGDRVTVGQEFVPDFDHLRAVTVWMTTEGPEDVELLCRLASVSNGPALLYRWTERLHIDGRSAQTFRFPPVIRASGQRFRFELTATRVVPGLALEAWANDAVRPGFLVVNGREQWGDLAYEVHASTLAQVLASTPRAVPRWLRQPVVLLAVATIHAAAAAWFWIGLAGAESTRGVGGTTAALAMAAVVMIGATLVSGRDRVPASGGHGVEPAFDLIRSFDAARKESDISLERAFEVGDVTIAGDRRRAIGAHPTSRIEWRVTLPDDAWLRTALAIRPDAWALEGDGVRFRVGVRDSGRIDVLASYYIDPKNRGDDRKWFPLRVDLTRYRGRTLDVILATDPGPDGGIDARSDWAVWAEPAIVVGKPE